MIQITKKMLNCFFKPKMKENEISRSFDQLACAFPKKIFEDKVKSESFDQFAKNQPTKRNKMIQ